MLRKLAPLLLLLWLAVMVVLGWPSYRAGLTSPALYFGGTALCLLCIVGLYYHLKHRRKRH